jgi:nitrite reductase (NADH) small subunit
MNSNKTRIKIAEKKDIPLGKSIIAKIPGGREIALFNIDGHIYALGNSCPHMGGPLGEGEIEDCMVTCPWHGWQFDIKSGECQNMPGDDASSIPLIVQGDDIFIES